MTSLARAIADHLAILMNGRIVAHGRPDDVLDGINTTDDFNRIYEYSDFTGPPLLDDAKATVGGRQTNTLQWTSRWSSSRRSQ
jgi:phospholipid/cholesterol/gamma-HCH transport system ATP-binding protein